MPFRDFALAFYARPAIAAACLALQDQHGADVVLLLFLLWRARSAAILDGTAIAALDRGIQPWRRQVVQKLRQARRALKDASLLPGIATAALRDTIKAAELGAELLQIAHLQALADDMPGLAAATPEDAARQNLQHYAAHLHQDFPTTLSAILLGATDHLTPPAANV